MKVKLQPPSATDLPAYNPILPPAAITQVMLLANPNKVCTVIFCSPALLEVYKNMLGFVVSQNKPIAEAVILFGTAVKIETLFIDGKKRWFLKDV